MYEPTLHCSDATDLLLSLEAGSVDLLYFDPPYGQTKNGWDVPLDLELLWKGISHTTHERTPIVVHSQGMYTATLMKAWESAWRYNLIWDKQGAVRGFLNANRMPLRAHEDIVVFYRRLGTYNPQFTYGHPPLHGRGKRARKTENYNYGRFEDTPVDPETATRRHPTSMLRIAPVKFPVFPVQKPIELARWVVRTYSNEGDLVVDPTMGSGTGVIAATLENRRAVGGDLFQSQVDLTSDRLAKEIPQ